MNGLASLDSDGGDISLALMLKFYSKFNTLYEVLMFVSKIILASLVCDGDDITFSLEMISYSH